MKDYLTTSYALEYDSNFVGIPKGSFIPKDDYMLMTAKTSWNNKLTKEEQLQKIEDFIKANEVEVDLTDSNYIFLYKTTNLEGKSNDSNNFVYTVGKTLATESIYANIYDNVLKVQKQNVANYFHGYGDMFTTNYINLKPVNPSVIKEQTFRVFKVRINKDNITEVSGTSIKVSELEIVSEVNLEVKFKYVVNSIQESKDGFNFAVDVENTITGKSIRVSFVSEKVLLSQDEIKTEIKKRITVMQDIYDVFIETNGEIEL